MSVGRPREFDREEVLTKAMEVFWMQGYRSTGMAELLEHLGIGRQSLYRTFGDKRTLYMEALNQFGSFAISQYRQELEGVHGSRDRLRVIFDNWHSKIDMTEHAGCGCFLGNALIEFGESDPEIAELASSFLEKLEDLLVVELEAGRREGILRGNVPPRNLAKWLVSILEGMALMSRSKSCSDTLHGIVDTTWSMLVESR